MAAALNVAVTPPAAFGSLDSSRPVSSASGKSAATRSTEEFSMAVHAISHRAAAAAGKLEAPIPIRLMNNASANSSAASFAYSGSPAVGDRDDGSAGFWIDDSRNNDGRPSFTSEVTDLSTLTARSRPPGGDNDFDDLYDEDVTADDRDPGGGPDSAESTLSDDGSEPRWDGWEAAGDASGVAALGELQRHQQNLIETDRTSVSSSDDWDDCEYEMIAAQRVNDLFEQIDSLLYSRTEPLPSSFSSSPSASSSSSSAASHLPPPSGKTHEECAEWRTAFPHLRLRGQLLAPRTSAAASSGDSAGFSQHPPPDDATPRAALDRLADGRDGGQLQLCGRSLAVRSPATDGLTCDTPGIEEVLAQEGCVEEAIALDDLVAAETSGGVSAMATATAADSAAAPPARPAPRRSRSVVEPVTPGLALRDAAQCAAFDALWGRMVVWAMPLFMERLRRSRRFQQSKRQEQEEEDEQAGPLISHHGGPAGSRHPHRQQHAGAAGSSRHAAAAAPSDPRLVGDLAGLLSISSKTLQLRADAPALLAPGAVAANAVAVASAAGFIGRRPLNRLAPVSQHHQLPHLLPQHQQSQHAAGLYAAFTRSGTLPPLHDNRRAPPQQPPLIQLTPAQQPHPLTMRGSGPTGRPGSGGRPGAYSSLDWPAAPTGRAGGPRANSGLHLRGLDVHGRALGAPAELDALYETPVLRTPANSLHFSPATNSYQHMRRTKQAGIIRR